MGPISAPINPTFLALWKYFAALQVNHFVFIVQWYMMIINAGRNAESSDVSAYLITLLDKKVGYC